jgi:tripartite-type tricarboxylate transporter receptor subunit TctC
MIKIKRLCLCVGFVMACTVHAQDFPLKPVRLVVPNAPGGGTDILARMFASGLEGLWKQPVVVEYKPGGGMLVGTDYVAKSAPDGYTIAMVATAHVINPSLHAKLPFDTIRDLSGVSLNSTTHLVMLAYPGLAAQTVGEIIAMAKKEPGKMSYASAGTGSSMHLAGELLKSTAGVDIQHIPYKGGGPAFLDVIGGRIAFMFNPLYSSETYIKSGKLRAVAVASPTRVAGRPEIPAIAETLPGFDVRSVNGMVVPSATPRSVVRKINADVVALMKQPAFRAKMTEIGLDPVGSTPEEFDAYIKTEIAKWSPIVKASGAQPD